MTKSSRLRNLALILALVGGIALPGFAANEQKLGELENKFFFHDYRMDTPEERLGRLERMIFGQEREGGSDARLHRLLSAAATAGSGISSGPAPPSSQGSVASSRGHSVEDREPPAPPSNVVPPASSKYPAVAAIEKKLFRRDFANEPVAQRLERIEKTVLGRAGSGPIADRVDFLRERTGVDVARQQPGAREWADEDGEPSAGPIASSNFIDDAPPQRFTSSPPPQASRMQRPNPKSLASTAPAKTAATPKPSAVPKSPSNGTPRVAPNLIAHSNVPPPAAPPRTGSTQPSTAPSLGIVRQLSALEHQFFGRTFSGDALTARIGRLESAVFPMQEPPYAQPLSERISRLLRAVQTSSRPVPLAHGRMQRPTMPQNPPLFNGR